MGRIIVIISILLISSSVFALEPITQSTKDAIRELYVKKILATHIEVVTLQDDVRAIRKLFSVPNEFDHNKYNALPNIPIVQIFSGKTIDVDTLISLIGLSSGYDVTIHPQADLTEKVSIDNTKNPLHDIADYLDHFSKSIVTVYPETKMISVFPNLGFDVQYSDNNTMDMMPL